jgi:putative ABC transport system ATP-binding protein
MLIARNLTKTYSSGGRPLTVLKEVSLEVEDGGFLAIVGPSGCGKTTLLGLLAGLDTPTSGTVRLGDHDLSALSEDGRARLRGEQVGFVFQTFQLIPTLTALENVQVPLELAGTGARGHGGTGYREIVERARELLVRVGLEGREHHYPAQLSGGEQQRVAIARAFVNRPRILFADEPTGNLDADTGAHIIDLLDALNRESGATIVLATHDADLAARAKRNVHLVDGAVARDSARA